jgi:hypothetical protein
LAIFRGFNTISPTKSNLEPKNLEQVLDSISKMENFMPPNRKPQAIVFTAFLLASCLVFGQEKCEVIFSESSQQVVHELARLRVDVENSGNPFLTQALSNQFIRKLREAEAAHLDLSELPQAVEAVRNQGRQKIVEEKKHIEKIRREEHLLDEWQVTKTLQAPGSLKTLQIHPSRDEILIDDGTHTQFMNLITGKKSRAYEGTDAALNPNGKLMATLRAGKPTTLAVTDTKSGHDYAIIPLEARPTSVLFSPDGRKIMTVGILGQVLVWAGDAGPTPVQKLLTKIGDDVRGVALSPDGQYLLVREANAAIMYDFNSQKKIHTFKHGQQKFIGSAVFSPDGTRVMTSSIDDKQARVWDTKSGKEVFNFKDDRQNILDAIFSPDGRHILTLSEDVENETTSAKLWTANGDLITSFKGPDKTALIAFNHDGTKIILANLFGTIQVLEQVPPEEKP